VIDRAVDLDSGRLQLVLEREEVLLGFDGEGDVVETDRLGGRRAMELAFAHGLGDVVFEERHLAGAHLEKVVPVAVVADPGLELQAQEVAVEADRLGHVVGNEREVIDALDQHGSPHR
jgi:hypothetical protein